MTYVLTVWSATLVLTTILCQSNTVESGCLTCTSCQTPLKPLCSLHDSLLKEPKKVLFGLNKLSSVECKE